jgi:hypothetical protein
MKIIYRVRFLKRTEEGDRGRVGEVKVLLGTAGQTIEMGDFLSLLQIVLILGISPDNWIHKVAAAS